MYNMLYSVIVVPLKEGRQFSVVPFIMWTIVCILGLVMFKLS